MKALLVIAHGSRREASNQEVRQLVARLKRNAVDRFDLFFAAFLELAEPDINDGIRQCVEAGANEIVVIPYFLAAGRHVVTDIPAELAEAQSRHPEVQILTTKYLGLHQGVEDLILDLAMNPENSTQHVTNRNYIEASS